MAGLLRNSYKKAVWLLYHTAFILGLMPAIAQHNLVPNGGFELLDTCPSDQWQIHFASPWGYLGSVDLFHSCCTIKVPSYLSWGTPDNHVGWQTPRSGDGYAGFLASVISAGGAIDNEYPQIKLSEPLIAGNTYCFQYYLSPTIRPNAPTSHALKEISIHFSNAPVIHNTWTPMTNYNYVNLNPTYTNYTGWMTDTSAWYEIQGEFVATGGEQYLTIGVFKRLFPSDTLHFDPHKWDSYSYFYIDDVSVYYCGPDTVPKPTELQLPEIPNVFTPNGDGFNDLFAFKNHEGWELETCIRNRWGQVVFEGKNDHWWDGTIHGQQASPGVYYYTVTARNHFGQHETFHGVVTLLR
jgi:gliding motility-associated-like protein